MDLVAKVTKENYVIQEYPGIEHLKDVLRDATMCYDCRHRIMVLHFIGACEEAKGEYPLFDGVKEKYLPQFFGRRAYSAGRKTIQQVLQGEENAESVLQVILANVKMKSRLPKYVGFFKEEELLLMENF